MIKIPKSKRRQHSVTPSKRENKPTEQKPKAEVKLISIDAMVLEAPKGKCYFKRLKYKGCPHTARGVGFNGKGKFHPDTVLIDMNRELFVKDMYELFTDNRIELAPNTLKGVFDCLTKYVALLDDYGRQIDFSENNIDWFWEHTEGLIKKGEVSNGSFTNSKKMLSFILKQQNKLKQAKNLPSIKREKKGAADPKSLTPTGSKDVYKIMNQAYRQYTKHFYANEAPSICPIFNETLIRSLKNGEGEPLYSEKEINVMRLSAKRRVICKGDWRNIMTKLAFFISARWTGGNLTPLVNLQRRDVRFKKLEGDNYELESIKGRAGFEEQPIGLGFNKQTKEFVESWLQISEKIAPHDDDWLFPFIGPNGETKHIGFQPQTVINKALTPYGLSVTTGKLRNTRSSFMMRATGDFIKTANANRNTIGTTVKHYLNGDGTTEEIQLAGAMEAQARMAKGEDKKPVIDEVIAKFKDPLSDFEYKKKTGKVANKTKNGARCAEPFGERAKKSARKYRGIKGSGAANDNKLDPCIDFLECFECPDHVLISEVDDIWLMLSFKDSLIETRARPSFNSTPTEKGEKLLMLVDAALYKFKEASPENYKEAEEKHKSVPHPLYDDEYAIEDMIEVYK